MVTTIMDNGMSHDLPQSCLVHVRMYVHVGMKQYYNTICLRKDVDILHTAKYAIQYFTTAEIHKA